MVKSITLTTSLVFWFLSINPALRFDFTSQGCMDLSTSGRKVNLIRKYIKRTHEESQCGVRFGESKVIFIFYSTLHSTYHGLWTVRRDEHRPPFAWTSLPIHDNTEKERCSFWGRAMKSI